MLVSPPYEKIEKGSGQMTLYIACVARAPYGAHQSCSSKRSHDTLIMSSMLITPKCVRSQMATMDVESALIVATRPD